MLHLYSFIIVLLIFSTQVFAFEDADKENKKREKAYEEAVSILMENYKRETVPEEERVIEYKLNGWGLTYEEKDENKFGCTITFEVEPFSEGNSRWKGNHKSNYCFAEFSKVDGEYNVDWVSFTPRYYDEFLERFEEYKKNGNKVVNVEATPAEKTEELHTSQIEKMSNIIFIISAIILLIVVFAVIVKIVRKRK